MSKFQAQIKSYDNQEFGAYVATPETPNGHAIVLLQEIFGVTQAIRDVAERYAQAGYLVFAPDLFWRLEPGIELSHSREDIKQALSLLEQFDHDKGLEDISATAAHIRALPEVTGKVAVVGLCMGGLLTYLSCTKNIFDRGIAFYGVGIEKHLDLADQLTCPIMLHFGRKDEYVPEDAQEKISQALGQREKTSLHFYDDVGHGFYTRSNSSAITVSHERSLAFLEGMA